MVRLIILCLSLLCGITAQAHPEWKEANCVGVIDDQGEFRLTIKFDIPSYLIGKLPKEAPVKELDALMFGQGTLAPAVESGRLRFAHGVNVLADGKPLFLKLDSFPTAEDILLTSRKQGEADRYPVLLNGKFSTHVPAGTRQVVIRFPDELGTVFTNLRKGMEFQTVMAVTKLEPGEFVISDEPAHPEDMRWWQAALRYVATLFGDGFSHVIPEGWDHLLFMAMMFAGAASLRQALYRSLIFTVGHSITLTFVALGLVGNVGPWIEPIIALTIGIAGVMAYLKNSSESQMLIVPGVFGLVHGLGFAAAVSDRLGNWDRTRIVQLLIGFNLGVELAQALAICLLAGLLWALVRAGLNELKIRRLTCLVGAGAGFALMFARLFALVR
jgi:hypothetical protein